MPDTVHAHDEHHNPSVITIFKNQSADIIHIYVIEMIESDLARGAVPAGFYHLFPHIFLKNITYAMIIA